MHIILAKLTNMQIYKSNCRYNMHNIHYKHIANIPDIISQKYNMYNKPILHLSIIICKQGRDDIIVKVNLQSPIPTSFYIAVAN